MKWEHVPLESPREVCDTANLPFSELDLDFLPPRFTPQPHVLQRRRKELNENWPLSPPAQPFLETEIVSSPTYRNDPYVSSLDKFRPVQKLSFHKGCVNTARWNAEGSFLVSGSDDRSIALWKDTLEDEVSTRFIFLHAFPTSHTQNIFDAQFVPDKPNEVVTCAADGEIRHNILEPFHASHPNNPQIRPQGTDRLLNQCSLEDTSHSPGMAFHVLFSPNSPRHSWLLAKILHSRYTIFGIPVRIFKSYLPRRQKFRTMIWASPVSAFILTRKTT